MKINKFRARYNQVYTTVDTFKEEDVTKDGLLVDSKEEGGLKPIQKVIAVGPMVQDIKVGEYVAINISRYAVKKHKEGSLKDGVITDNPVIDYNLNIIEVGEDSYVKLFDNDIEVIVEEFED